MFPSEKLSLKKTVLVLELTQTVSSFSSILTTKVFHLKDSRETEFFMLCSYTFPNIFFHDRFHFTVNCRESRRFLDSRQKDITVPLRAEKLRLCSRRCYELDTESNEWIFLGCLLNSLSSWKILCQRRQKFACSVVCFSCICFFCEFNLLWIREEHLISHCVQFFFPSCYSIKFVDLLQVMIDFDNLLTTFRKNASVHFW